MKNDFKKYLKEIGIEKTIEDRIKNILDFYKKHIGVTFQDICVSEYIKDDGSRVYEDLWLFNKNFICECKNFIKEDNFDFAPVINITYWELKKKEYTPENSNGNSRLNINFQFGDINGKIRTSKSNCDHLFKIFTKYIQGNILTANK